MKINFWLLLGSVIIGLGLGVALQDYNPFVAKPQQDIRYDAGETVPSFDMTDIFGRDYKIEDFRGKTVLLNFWASWCPPCIVEFPDMVYRAQNNDNIIFLAVSSDHNKEKMDNFLQQQDLLSRSQENVIIVHDTDKAITQDLFQTYRLPETIIIDAEGRMIEKVAGAIDWKEKSLPTNSLATGPSAKEQ